MRANPLLWTPTADNGLRRGAKAATIELVDEQTIELFRPEGPRELTRIRQSGWRAFPPRLPSQPIFCPVTNEAHARQIAQDWNATKPET